MASSKFDLRTGAGQGEVREGMEQRARASALRGAWQRHTWAALAGAALRALGDFELIPVYRMQYSSTDTPLEQCGESAIRFHNRMSDSPTQTCGLCAGLCSSHLGA